MTALTAMIYLNNQQNNSNRFDSSKGSSYSQTQEREREVNDKAQDYENLINKLKFYDDPLLYSSDDEAKKKASNANSNSVEQKIVDDSHKN